jgi:hypothetical protein
VGIPDQYADNEVSFLGKLLSTTHSRIRDPLKLYPILQSNEQIFPKSLVQIPVFINPFAGIINLSHLIF